MTIEIVGTTTAGANKLIAVPQEHWVEFQQLIQRGANLWPDASAAIKSFADAVTSGRELQDYNNRAEYGTQRSSRW